MPLIRVDENDTKNPESKERSVHDEAVKKVYKKKVKSDNRKRNLYPLYYVLIAIAVFGLGLLTIALINLAIGRGFII